MAIDIVNKVIVAGVAMGALASPLFVVDRLHQHELESRNEFASKVEIQAIREDVSDIKKNQNDMMYIMLKVRNSQ